MESSLRWLEILGTNIKKIWDEIVHEVYGLHAIRSFLGNFEQEGETVAHKLDNLNFDTSDLAKEATLEVNTQTILTKIETTQPDLSEVAKESQATLNKEEIIEAINTKLVADANEIYNYLNQ